MDKIRTVLASLLFSAAFIVPFSAKALPVYPEETLRQYVSELQKDPDDTVLREKIITHVRSMRRMPVIPEEARRYFIEGNTLLKAAKDQKGYELAIATYRQCLLIAPWWPEANYNFAVALELANRFDSAVNALKLYIATSPGREETRKAQDKIYEIGAKKRLAAMDSERSSPQGATREQNEFENWLKKLDGRRYTLEDSGTTGVLDVRGRSIEKGYIEQGTYHKWDAEAARFEINGRETTVPLYRDPRVTSVTYSFSEDGERITTRVRFKDGDSREYIYLWQR